MEKYSLGEVLFSSSNTVVQRATKDEDGTKVIIKKPTSYINTQHMNESYKKDFSFTKIVHESAPEYFVTMVEIAPQKNGQLFLVEEDSGLNAMTSISQENDLNSKVQEFLKIAKEMTMALHHVHNKQIIHRDIKLSNFISTNTSSSTKPKLIDFGLATIVSRKSPSVSCSHPTGTYNYMSPEQTGRVNKNIDFRSDIYSLGITFYELFTGNVPFNGDKLALVHAHITKKLPLISEMPKVVNNVIQKMCAKNPSERYHSAIGVYNDLDFIQKNFDKMDETFSVGMFDEREFQIPNKLYGREKEIELLKQAINSNDSMCLVSGYSGSGKSKLIEEISKDQHMELLMAFGKFDQFNRLQPFSAFISAMKSLIIKVSSTEFHERNIVTENLKHDLKGDLGDVVHYMIPEIAMYIGERKPPIALGSTKETQDRIFKSFISYFNCFTTDHKLILIIDDLQWADAASFQFFEKLLSTGNQDIFIIGAYRDNEIDDSHPLTGIIKQYNNTSSIHLEPLTLEDLNELVAETLHVSTNESWKLSELIHKKTLGNPFFSREFINTLHQEEFIHFENEKWNWDVEKVDSMNFSSNVIDFMIQNLKKLPKNMQKLLNRASCIGNTFKISELKWIYDDNQIEKDVVEALREGWLFQINSGQYKFFHDRLQQAAYELFDVKEIAEIHSINGNILLKNFKEQKTVDMNIFSIVNHLNKSPDQLKDKKELLELNLLAAKKSLENSAKEVGLNFAKISIEMLSSNPWESDPKTAFSTYSMLAEGYYSNYMFKECEEVYKSILENVKVKEEKLIVYSKYSKMACATAQYDQAYDLFIEVLKLFDFSKDIPFTDIPGTIKFNFGLKAKLDQELQLIGGLTKLESLQKCTDPNITLFCKILIASIDVMFLAPKSNRMLLMTNALMVLYLNITMGLMDTSAFSFAYAGWVFSFFFKSTDGYYLTTLGDKFFSKDVNPPYNVAAFKMIIGQGSVTGGNLKQHIENLNQGYKYSTLHSEYIFGAYCLLHETIAQVLNGENYLTLIQKCEIKSNEYMKSKNVFMRDCLQLILNFARDMTGVSNFKPEYKIPAFKKLKTVSSFILYMEGVLNYFKGNYEAAAPFFLDVDKIINNQMGLFGFYESKFYTLMTCIHLYNKSKDEKDLEDIQRRLKEYESFAILSPEFLYPKYRLASAFLETTQPNVDNFVVISKFEDIIESTTLFGLVTSTAIAYEIMLQFCHEKKFSAGICKMYLSECLRIWSSLSAKTKCNKLQQEYAKYVSIHRTNSMPSMSISASTTAMSGTSINSSYSTSPGYGAMGYGESLDMMSIIKASQALSVELTTVNLIFKVMEIIIENTGAENGLLFLEDSNKMEYLETQIGNGKIKQIHKLATSFKENEKFCSFLLSLSKTIRKTIIINNVSGSEYSDNDYLQKNEIKSICIHPIIKGKKYIGSIYLENKSLEGIFDENRKEILQHISSQLAISYENAKLYDDMNLLNLSYERFLPKEFLNQLGKGDVRNIKKGDASTKKFSVLFSDIRGFTNITEKMNPEESFSFVNEILSYLAPVISKHNGFIDKFFGDCIMALFPYNVDDSIKCGYEMLSELKVYNKECRKGMIPIDIGIGIHFGNVMLGTIGAEERIDATVISDTVNTASRVESLTKALGANFIVTEELLQQSTLVHKNRYIGKYLLKGKELPIALFHMIQSTEGSDDDFSQAIRLFESGKFEKSEEIFVQLTDKTSKYLLKVVGQYKKYSFNENWNGEIKIDKDGNLIHLENELKIDSSIKKLSKENKKQVLNDLLTDEDFELFLKSISKENPEKVQQILNKYQ